MSSSAEFDAKCPHCKTELSVPIEMKGTKAPCPNCNMTFILKQALRVKGASPEIPPRQESPPPDANGHIGRICPHCNANISSSAVVCGNCGVFITTGRKIGQNPPPASSAVTNRLATMAGPVALLLLIGGGVWYYCHDRNEKAEKARIAQQVDNERMAIEKAEQQRLAKEQEKLKEEAKEQAKLKEEQAKREEERLRAETIRTQAEKDRQAALAKARTPVIQVSITELNNLQGADNALKTLLKEPESVVALQKISTVATDCSDPDVKSVLTIVNVYAELSRGNLKMAESAMAYLKDKVPDSPYLAQVKIPEFKLPCAHCQNGEIQTRCSVCKRSNGSCVQCFGRGTVASKKDPMLTLAGPRDVYSSSFGQTVYVTCKTCNGSGKCPGCKGTGFLNTKCTYCDGTGTSGINVEKAHNVLTNFLGDKAISVVHAHLLDAKGLILFEEREMTPAEKDLILAEREKRSNGSLSR